MRDDTLLIYMYIVCHNRAIQTIYQMIPSCRIEHNCILQASQITYHAAV